MDFLIQLFTAESVAHTILILALIISLGLTFGSLRFFGVRLGVAGVLFSGLLFGHFKMSIPPEIAEFVREFGLVLFVYTIGMQVGPRFFSSLKKDGLQLNLIAAFVVIAGAAIAIGLSRFAGVPMPVAAGLFSGATTNTPSLAAAQQALKEMPGVTSDMLKMPGLGYAVAYPFGIIGIILTMLFIRTLFGLKPAAEAEAYLRDHAQASPVLETMDIRVDNKNFEGCEVRKIPALNEAGIVISRVLHNNEIEVALPDTKISTGDIIRAVGAKQKLEALKMIIGSVSSIELRGAKNSISARKVLVTKKNIPGKTLAELDASETYGVTITRVRRGDVEFPATPEVTINFADTLVVVGDEVALKKFASDMGDSEKDLDHPLLIPIFIGVTLGMIAGTFPIHVPGIPVPVKLGLAGGPLLVAMLLSRVGRIGRLVWFMPVSANLMMREIGICLFLACVGLRSGDQFIHTLVQGEGFYWMACGALITAAPLLAAALYARWKDKTNYLTICGLLAGSMTDPPALAFANQQASSNAQVVAYAAVYPLVMLLRVVAAQLMVIFLMK